MSRNSAREHIAHLAARLMAEDGIEDHALAKRKAARQAGIADLRQLPDNDEIDSALRSYRALYQKQHPAQLRELRALAVDLMTEFSRFNPHLTGSVLNGTAGRFADIQLQLFAESAKDVEFELFNRAIRHETGAMRFYAGDMPVEAVVFSFERDAVTVRLIVLAPDALRARIKSGPAGKPVERADQAAVEQLLAEQEIQESPDAAADFPEVS